MSGVQYRNTGHALITIARQVRARASYIATEISGVQI